jgi:hypothetical protein
MLTEKWCRFGAWRLLLAGVALGVTFAAAPTAFAKYKRMVGSVCQATYMGHPHRYEGSDTDYGIYNFSNFRPSLICPVPNNTAMPNTAAGKLTQIWVGASDGNAVSGEAVNARLCARAALSPGVNCGSPASSHDYHPATWTTPHTFLKLHANAHLWPLGTEGQILYLFVTMPYGSGQSRIRSLYFEAP